MRWPIAAVVVATALAGCLATTPSSTPAAPGPAEPAPNLSTPGFAEPVLLDRLRAGGEPVVLALPDDVVLVASHPGWTHVKGADPGIAVQNGQVHLWRSTDGGASFTHVGAEGLPVGPRDRAVGVSDPDLTVGADGRVYLSQLSGATTSVSWSDDQGASWTANPAPFPSGDRNWIAAGAEPGVAYHTYRCDEVYRTTDGGETWEQRSPSGVDGNLNVGPDGTVYCRGPLFPSSYKISVSVSTDGAETWESRDPPWRLPDLRGLHMNEPAVDDAGNVYVTWVNATGVHLGYSTDRGRNWSDPIRLTDGDRPRHWPWVTAGSAGRVGVVWLQQHGEDWFVESAVVGNATSKRPAVARARVTPDPVHAGPICQGGTSCQIGPGDRKLGDFFSADVGPDGRLHVAVGTTQHTLADGLSHPLYVRQTDGPRLDVGAGPRSP